MKNTIIIYQPLFCCGMTSVPCILNTPPDFSCLQRNPLLRRETFMAPVVHNRRCDRRSRQSHPSFTLHEGSRYMNIRLSKY